MSANTYMRRCQISSLLCLNAEDDDGNKASEKPTSNKTAETNINQKIVDEKIKLKEQAKSLYIQIHEPSDEQNGWISAIDVHADRDIIMVIQEMENIIEGQKK